MFRTLHAEMNSIARGISTPDQSSNMLLMAKAQYVIRISESPPCPGSVKKLMVPEAKTLSHKLSMLTCRLPFDTPGEILVDHADRA
jgi:hypothetical protein